MPPSKSLPECYPLHPMLRPTQLLCIIAVSLTSACLCRRLAAGFVHRLAPVIFENAFVVQGAGWLGCMATAADCACCGGFCNNGGSGGG